jgi:hypothetical protein
MYPFLLDHQIRRLPPVLSFVDRPAELFGRLNGCLEDPQAPAYARGKDLERRHLLVGLHPPALHALCALFDLITDSADERVGVCQTLRYRDIRNFQFMSAGLFRLFCFVVGLTHCDIVLSILPTRMHRMPARYFRSDLL